MNWMVVVYVGCEILVAIGAIFGNTLVITAFRRERRLRRRTNYYIVSLAVADLLVGLLGIPCALLAYSGYPKQLHACLFTVSLLVVLCTISIFSLVAVSVDRYWAILYPMGYSRNVRTKTAVGIICFCWVAGAIVGFLPLLGWNAGQSGQELEECRFTKVMNYNFLVFIYFATIIFPGLLMAAFYAHIYSVVVKQLKQMVTVNGTSGGSGAMLRVLGAARKREVKATQNLSIIVLFFMVCWFPLYTINFIQAYHKDISIPTFLMDSCIILTHLNSAGNPLLYAYHLRDFRTALRAVLFGGATLEADRRVIGRDNSAYLHDLEQRRRSSQLNLYAKTTNKDQNLNLTHLPVIHNKLSDIQESSRNESSIKVVIPTENNEISKTTSFFKFPLDRSLSLLKTSDKEKTTQRMSNFGSEKQDFTYNHLEESNASLANDGSTGRVEGREGLVVNGGVVNNGFLKRDEGGLEEKEVNDGKLENTAKTGECNDEKDGSLSTKVLNNDEKQDCNGNLDGSYSRKSGSNTGEREGKKEEESCDDADYGDDETDEDEDTNVKTGNEITTGIFNDCFVEDDDEDSVDEIDNSILSNDRVSTATVKNDGETCVGYRNLDDSNDRSTKLQDVGESDLRRLDSENDQVSISSRNLEKVDSEVGIPYRNLEKVDSDIDIPYCELKKVDSEISIPYRKIQQVDSEVDIPYCELKKPDTEVETPLCNLKKVDSDFDTPDCDLERVDSEVDIPYNKLSSNDLEGVGESYNDLNISKECEKVGFTFSNLQEDEDLKQMCGNLDRKDSEKSSQQGLKYKNLDDYEPETLEDVDIPYCSLDQKDLGGIEGKEKSHLRAERQDLYEREIENFPKNVDSSDTSISDEGASCKADSHSLKEVFKKSCMKQESVTPSNSKASTKTDENTIFEDPNHIGRTISSTSDNVTNLENLKHGNT